MISVFLVDDQQLVRSGLAMLVNSQPDMQVVGQAGNGLEAIEAVGQLLGSGHPVDLVLLDVRMPVMDGLEAAGHLLNQHPALRVMMLTTFDIDDYVYESLRLGASGFLLKDAPPEDILAAIRAIAQGDAVLAPSATRRLLDHLGPQLPAPVAGANPASSTQPTSSPSPLTPQELAAISSLTAREHEIFLLMAQGLNNAEIMQQLVLSEATVKTHVSHVLAKLEVRDRVQAVILAYQAGLVFSGRPSSTRPHPRV